MRVHKRIALLGATALLVPGACATSTPPPKGPSAARKIVEASGMQLDAAQLRRLDQIAGATPCPCPKAGAALTACLGEGSPAGPRRACVRGLFAVRAIARAVVRGAPDDQIHDWLRARFGQRPQQLDTSRSPCRGPANAPVELVVFSDFQCPACAFGRFVAQTLEQRSPTKLRLCFKNFPLSSIHPDALGAAKAAMAAHQQGKFWAMHDRLFDQQRALAREQLIAHARALGLDEQRFAADLDSETTRDLVARDLAEATALGLRGTPTFFINGRQMTDPMALPDFLDWIAEAAVLRDGGADAR